MKSARRAVIDVGTNSVKLLVGDVSAGGVTPVHEESRQTRLGAGFYETHLLRADAIARTSEAVACYAAQARQLAAERIHVLATSAARDARNSDLLVSEVRRHCGLTLEIVSGEQEAHWAFEGVCSDPSFGARALFIVDAGGGSTQLVHKPLGGAVQRLSLHVGAVRLLEKFRPSDPPGEGELATCVGWIDARLAEEAGTFRPADGAREEQPLFVTTGGTSSLLAMLSLGLRHFDRERIESVVLSHHAIRQWLERLWSLSLARRKALPGMPAKKADVILTGAAIHATVMRFFGLEAMRVSTRGIRFGALLEPSAGEPA